MNKDFISELSSSLAHNGLTIENKLCSIAVSPIVAHNDLLSFSVFCRKRTDREAKIVEYKIVDLPAKPTVIATLAALERIIND
jgi:hypothetical protein